MTLRHTTEETGETAKGQSAVLGFVLVFGLVLSLIATVTMFGFPALLDVQSNEANDLMERTFEELTERTGTATSVAGELKFEMYRPAGTLRPADQQTEITVSQDGSPVEHSITSQPFVFSPNGPADPIIFDSGLTAQYDTKRNTARILDLPPTSETTTSSTPSVPTVGTLTLYGYEMAEKESLKGHTRETYYITLKNNPGSRTTEFSSVGSDSVSITITSSHPEVWATALENHPQITNVATSGDQVTADLAPDQKLRLSSHSIRLKRAG